MCSVNVYIFHSFLQDIKKFNTLSSYFDSTESDSRINSVFSATTDVFILQDGNNALMLYLKTGELHPDVIEAFLRCNADVYHANKVGRVILYNVHIQTQCCSARLLWVHVLANTSCSIHVLYFLLLLY